jgi:hypothetical protein
MTRTTIVAALAVLLAGGGACGGKKQKAGAPPAVGGDLRAVQVQAAPVDDPADAAWRRAPELTVALMPQTVAHPRAAGLHVQNVRARALVDATWLAVRLEWDDATEDLVIDGDRFSDGVAIQIPLGPAETTNPMMGDPSHPVYIAQWSAAWQRDVDKGRWDVQDRHPGFWSDSYPFAGGDYPYPLEESFQSADARRYLVAISAGNPQSRIHRRFPVEELEARGFGTLTTQRTQDARGRGGWADGKWAVVIAVPRHAEDPLNPALGSGTHAIGVAVWEGTAEDVSGRKQWAPFTQLVIP